MNLDKFYSRFFISEGGRFTSLEGVRALAIFLVFNVHVLSSYNQKNYFTDSALLQDFYKVLAAGHIGVDLFFVLSGFLIIRTIPKSNNIYQFMLKRYKRLWPVVFATTIFSVLNKPILKIFDNLSLLMIFTKKPVNFVNWSLTYEIYFYFFTAVWFFYFRKAAIFRRYGVFLFGILLLGFFVFLNKNTEFFFIREPYRFMGFFWGILLSLFYDSALFKNDLVKKMTQWIWILPLFSIPMLQYAWGPMGVGGIPSNEPGSILFYFTVQSQFFLLLTSLLNSESSASSFFSLRPLRYLGTISYSFYVIHWLWGIKLTNSLLKHLPDAQIKIICSLILAFVLNVIFASVLYLWLEKPYFKKKQMNAG